MVEVMRVRIVPSQLQGPTVLEPEGHPAVLNFGDLSGAAVDKTEALFVAGPADAVAGTELDALGAIDLDAAGSTGYLVGLPWNGSAVRAFQHHRPARVIDRGDAALVARCAAMPGPGAGC